GGDLARQRPLLVRLLGAGLEPAGRRRRADRARRLRGGSCGACRARDLLGLLPRPRVRGRLRGNSALRPVTEPPRKKKPGTPRRRRPPRPDAPARWQPPPGLSRDDDEGFETLLLLRALRRRRQRQPRRRPLLLAAGILVTAV